MAAQDEKEEVALATKAAIRLLMPKRNGRPKGYIPHRCDSCEKCLARIERIAARKRALLIESDDDRWNRIFKEKFEDPTYYEKRVQTLQSSLSSD